eukprot:11969703-Karenia_brevis.AAC.1
MASVFSSTTMSGWCCLTTPFTPVQVCSVLLVPDPSDSRVVELDDFLCGWAWLTFLHENPDINMWPLPGLQWRLCLKHHARGLWSS